MSDFSWGTVGYYTQSSGSYFTVTSGGGTIPETVDDDTYLPSEAAGTDPRYGQPQTYVGTIDLGGTIYPVFSLNNGSTDLYAVYNPDTGIPAGSINPANIMTTSSYAFCFAEGTVIDTGDMVACKVQDLQIGDFVRTVGGSTVPVKWIGRQTVHKLFSGPRMQPVRIGAGALGGGLPHSDLTVTADHGMIIDGLVINASALVNGGSIDWVPMAELPDRVTYYHIETEAHDVILANGAPAETFVDMPGRQAFDNYQEYLDLYGAERIVPEMDRPRIASQRLLPDAIRARLGIAAEAAFFEMAVAG